MYLCEHVCFALYKHEKKQLQFIYTWMIVKCLASLVSANGMSVVQYQWCCFFFVVVVVAVATIKCPKQSISSGHKLLGKTVRPHSFDSWTTNWWNVCEIKIHVRTHWWGSFWRFNYAFCRLSLRRQRDYAIFYDVGCIILVYATLFLHLPLRCWTKTRVVAQNFY